MKNKHFEKFLLVFGVVALIAGIGGSWRLGSKSAKTQTETLAGKLPTNNPYTPIPLPEVSSTQIFWNEPPQRKDGEGDPSLWTYDLFTPVEVRWNAVEKKYIPKGLTREEQPPFGIKLVAWAQPVYRLTVDGIYPGAPSKGAVAAKPATVTLYDEEFEKNGSRGRQLRPAKKGEKAKVREVDYSKRNSRAVEKEVDPAITVLDIERKPNRDDDWIVSLQDADPRFTKYGVIKLDTEKRLKTGPRKNFFELPELNVVFALADNPSKTWTIQLAGSSDPAKPWTITDSEVKVDGVGTFKLIDVDSAARTTTLTKSYKTRKGKNAKQTETLSLETSNTTTTTPKVGTTLTPHK